LAWAVPCEPEMIAPRGPSCAPGRGHAGDIGHDGLCHVLGDEGRGTLLLRAAISPISMTASVSGSSSNASRQSMKFVPGQGRHRCPRRCLTDPLLGQLVEGLVGQGAERETMPTGPPARAMSPEVMPMFVFPGR